MPNKSLLNLALQQGLLALLLAQVLFLRLGDELQRDQTDQQHDPHCGQFIESIIDCKSHD